MKRELVLLSPFDGRCMLGADVMLMRIQNWPATVWIVKSHDCYMILHIFYAKVNTILFKTRVRSIILGPP